MAGQMTAGFHQQKQPEYQLYFKGIFISLFSGIEKLYSNYIITKTIQ
jgi:hypothetical protein